jgi:hypothetical protein
MEGRASVCIFIGKAEDGVVPQKSLRIELSSMALCAKTQQIRDIAIGMMARSRKTIAVWRFLGCPSIGTYLLQGLFRCYPDQNPQLLQKIMATRMHIWLPVPPF